MLDLLVINPSAAHGIYGSDLASSLIAVEPPLWCRVIGAYVRDRGYSVRILDMEAEQMGVSGAQLVLNYKPRLVCIAVYGHQPSASTQQMHAAGLVAKQIKALSDVPIIMVGGHVAALPERTLREESVDYVSTGEGLTTVLGMLESDRKNRGYFRNAPGLMYLQDKGAIIPPASSSFTCFTHVIDVRQWNFVRTADAPSLDMSEYDGDAWDLLPMERYRAHNWQCLGGWPRSPYAAVASSFNCPYKCTFCCISAPFGNHVYKKRNPALVVAEMEWLYHEHGVRTFKIVDEMFILNEKHYTAIAQGLIDCGIAPDINIWAYARVDTVVDGHLPLLRRAGFRWLALGIESASKYVRDGSNKRLKNDDIIGVVRTIQDHDINVIGNFMFGLPDDTLETMEDTFRLALASGVRWANFYCTMAYPGSELHTLAVKQNKTLPDEWAGYSQHNAKCRPLDTDHVSAAEVLRFRDAAFTRFFTDPDFLERTHQKFGPEAVQHILDMTKFKLKRNLLEAV